MMNPTEFELNAAVTAGAKAAYNQSLGEEEGPLFEDLNLLTQNAWKEAVLPVIFPALQALPDRLADVRTLVKLAEEEGDDTVSTKALVTLVAEPENV